MLLFLCGAVYLHRKSEMGQHCSHTGEGDMGTQTTPWQGRMGGTAKTSFFLSILQAQFFECKAIYGYSASLWMQAVYTSRVC